MIQLTCLMDNLPSENKALRAEHGLSIHIKTDSASFLFDCGSGENTIYNAHRLGIDLEAVDFTVCSHSHYDHAAGFRDMAQRGMGGRTLYTGEGFWEKKYALQTPSYTDLSCGFDESFLRSHCVSQEICGDMLELLPGVFALSGFERVNAFETIPERFVRDNGSDMQPDDFSDELCLAIDTADGIVMVVGCSHPGILNMAQSVYKRMNRPIYALLGGTHLVEADEERVNKTVAVLKDMGLKILGLSHCSGTLAQDTVRRDGTVQCCHLAVGDCIRFAIRE